MRHRFRTICLSVSLAAFGAGMGAAEPPEGKIQTVEAAGLPDRVEASMLSVNATGPKTPGQGATRAELLAEVESIDPTLWLLRFGQVEKRTLITPEP